MPQYILFEGIQAFAGMIVQQTRCKFWAKHPWDSDVNYSPQHWLDYDSSLCPKRAQGNWLLPVDKPAPRIPWELVLVDDQKADGGQTTLGAVFPTSQVEGSVYLKKEYLDQLRASNPGMMIPPLTDYFNAYDYEFHSLVMVADDGVSIRRYLGFHGEISGDEVHLRDRSHGKDPPTDVPHVFPVASLSDPLVCDQTYTTLKPSGDSGAVFLEASRAREMHMMGRKLPITTAEDSGV